MGTSKAAAKGTFETMTVALWEQNTNHPIICKGGNDKSMRELEIRLPRPEQNGRSRRIIDPIVNNAVE
jgi:hypothetical protein